MVLSSRDQIPLEQPVTRTPRSMRTAYVIWVLTGAMGGHRFYLRKFFTGSVMLLLLILGLTTLSAGVGAIILALVLFWTVVDAVLIPEMVQEQNTAFSIGVGQESIDLEGTFLHSKLEATRWSHADRERYLQQNERQWEPR